MGDELEHRVVSRLADRERRAGEMRAEVGTVCLDDDGRPTGARGQPAGRRLELARARARAGTARPPGARGAPRCGRERPRREGGTEERPGHLPAAGRDHDLAVRGARRPAVPVGPEVPGVDEALAEALGEREGPIERNRSGLPWTSTRSVHCRATATAASSAQAWFALLTSTSRRLTATRGAAAPRRARSSAAARSEGPSSDVSACRPNGKSSSRITLGSCVRRQARSRSRRSARSRGRPAVGRPGARARSPPRSPPRAVAAARPRRRRGRAPGRGGRPGRRRQARRPARARARAAPPARGGRARAGAGSRRGSARDSR